MNNDIELLDMVAKFEDDPVLFIEVFVGRKLSGKQRDFIEYTKNRNIKHVLAIWSRQSGKSTVIASYIVWRLLFGKGCDVNGEHLAEQIAVLAPIKDQLNNLYNKISSLIDKSEFISAWVVKKNTEIITMKNGNFAKFMSANPGSQIRGFTATLIVVDESQDITDNKYVADILPFGSTTNALVIEAGTPKTKNHFFTTINDKSGNVMVVRQMWFECPFISEEYVMSQKAISPDALWRQEYLCEFIEEGVMAFPSKLFEPDIETGRWNLAEYDYIKNMSELTQEYKTQIRTIVEEGATFTLGADLGKQNDNTVISVYRTDKMPIRQMLYMKFPLSTAYKDIAKNMSAIYKIYQPYEINIDYTNEKSFIEVLRDENVPVILDDKKRGALAFTTGNKTDMITRARILLEQYNLQLPKDNDELLSQFLNQQYEINSQGKYLYYHPTNEHDDGLWSTLLALKNVRGFVDPDAPKKKEVTFNNPWEKMDEDKSEETKEVLYKLKEKSAWRTKMSSREMRDLTSSRSYYRSGRAGI